MMVPEVCVGAIVVNDDELLMIRRGQGPAAGQWSVPGGRVELGELLEEAVVREVLEETGVEVVCNGFVDWVELIDEKYHYVVLDFACQVVGNVNAIGASDAAEAKWVPLHEVGELNLVDGLAEFLHTNGVISTIA